MAIDAIGGCVVGCNCCHLQRANADLSGKEIILSMFLKAKRGLEQFKTLICRNTHVFYSCNEGLAKA